MSQQLEAVGSNLPGSPRSVSADFSVIIGSTDVSGRDGRRRTEHRPNKEVSFLQIGKLSVVLVAIQAGRIDAGLVDMEYACAAQKVGAARAG